MPASPNLAVVTGSTSGIGRQIAIRLARAGFDIVVHGNRNKSGGQETTEAIKQLGRQAETVMADIGQAEGRSRLVNTAFSFGRVQAWIHNAGVDVLTGPAAKLTFEEKLDRLWAVDVRGTMLLARQIAERMLDQTSSSLSTESPPNNAIAASTQSMVFIGWDQASEGMEGEAGQMFAPIKSAITSYSKSLAQQLAPQIRINCVAPGWIKTEWGQSTDDYWDRRATRSALMNRWGTPEDIASAVAFLVSPEASFICGQVVQVNGGWNRRFDRS